MYSWPWQHEVTERLLFCPPAFFFQGTFDCFLALFSRSIQFCHWADSHGGCSAIFMLYAIFVSKSLCLNRPDVGKRWPWNKRSQKANLSQKWLMWGKWKMSVWNKSDPAVCIWLKTSIAGHLNQIKVCNILIKQNQGTVTIFRMCLNMSVSIIWYTDIFSIYLKGLRCSDNICFYPKLLWSPCIQAGNSCPPCPSISRSNTAGFPVTRLLLSSWPSVQLIFFRPCIGLSVVFWL